MKVEIIKTKLIENGKSSYLIDLLKNESNLYYFTITQNTLNTATRSDIKSITFRSNMINDLIEDLQSMKQELYKLQNLSKEIYSIDFPLPVLKTILNKIALDVNTKESINFQLFLKNR